MPSRFWHRTAFWSGLAATGLTGCTSGVGRTALRDAPPLEDFQTVVVAKVEQPHSATSSAHVDATTLSPADLRHEGHPGVQEVAAASPLPQSGTVARESPAPELQLIEHRTPPPFPESAAVRHAVEMPEARPLIEVLSDEDPAAPPVTETGASLAPVAIETSPPGPASSGCQYALDLCTALAMVSGQNPEVGFARWRISEAYARLDQAQVLWLPTIQAGLNYHRHEGNLQNIEGFIRDINRSSLNAGLGAGAVAAGSTAVPGLVAQFHTSDAVFQPRIAERTAWARQHAADAVLQDQMLSAALAYLELLEAAQGIAIAQEIVADTADLAHITDQYARTGQGLQSDADRVQTELALRRNDAIRANERFAVASARLAEVLSLDANYQLLPSEVTVVPIDLVAVECGKQELLASGLSHRPELKEARCLVAEACERLQREKFAPLMPSVLLGMSYSGFGGGVGDNVSRFNDRTDFDALAYWQVRNLGFGERAQRQMVGSQIEQAKFAQVRLMDRIAREIVEAQTQIQHRRQQIDVAEGAVAAAEQSHQRNIARIREGQGLPIEALQSINALNNARREYLTSVMDYNEAQFRLQRALGWPVGAAS